MSIGENIRKLRKEKKLTQKELADKSDLSEISIRRYEKGINQPSTKTLQRIANALDISIETILMAEIDTISKNFRDMANTQTELIQKTLAISKDTTGRIAFQYLCRTCDIYIDKSSNEFDNTIPEYNIKFKSEDFNISEEDFQRLFRTVQKFIIKEVINSKYYDFIEE